MTNIKFAGFQPNATVTMSVAQGGLTRGPVTVSAWKASQTVPDAGTFRVRTSIVDENWSDVSEGDIIETVSPGRVRVWVDSFAGWADNDPRNIWVDVDYGERYDFQHMGNIDLPAPNVLRRLSGTRAGYYPGILSGHSMRGTDMSGNQVLTATHDQGNGAPLGTLDQTITVTVTDGLATDTFTFTVHLIHPDVYYNDRAKAIFTGGPETDRMGTTYFSRDGDFTGAPVARAATVTEGGVYHVTLIDGVFDSSDLPNNSIDSAKQYLFKAGQTFFPPDSFDPFFAGFNGQHGTWFHTGSSGDVEAEWDGERALRFNPDGTKDMLSSNYPNYTGVRLSNLKLKVSDYDVSDVTWREWWNVIKYTGKTGSLTENTSDVAGSGFNGETISNGNGVYTQVVSDDGNGTLICRQVVDTANVDDDAAEQDYFSDGDTLTGQTNGATMTFVAAGSRQDRTRKCPGLSIYMLFSKGMLLDNVQITGANDTVIGNGGVISDCLIRNYWNYGLTVAGGSVTTQISESGNVTVQPLTYEGVPRDFGGASVSGNRNFFNTMISGTQLATNDISHACRRFARIVDYSYHYCFSHTHGGHGAAHQPAFRMGTQGSTVEGQMTVQIYGSGISGGGPQITFSLANGGVVPNTPNVIRVENTHLLGTHATRETNFESVYTNYVLRNCILDRPSGSGWDQQDIYWLFHNDEAFNPSPDAGAVSPIVEFNTFTAFLNTSPASDVIGPDADLRGTSIIYRNNAFVLDQPVLGAVAPVVLALADAPGDYDSSLRPLAPAKAYQSGTDIAPKNDAMGGFRPDTSFSKGALEPA